MKVKMQLFFMFSFIVTALLCVLPIEILGVNVCPAGTYQPTGSTGVCIQCPIGTYQNIGGSSYCNQCPRGAYCPKIGASGINYCPAGTYQPKIGAISSADCLPCPPGTYQNIAGSSYCNE